MLRFTTYGVLLAVIAGCATTRGGGPLPSEPVLPEVQAMAGYEFGASRVPLTTVGGMVAARLNSGDGAGALADDLAALVSSDATVAAKQFALRQLALIGTERQVPAIAPLLLDGELSHMARYALEPIPGRAVDRALIDSLDAAPDELKAGIINTLGARGSKRAANRIEGYRASSDPAVAEAAAAALAKIRG